MNTGSLFNNLYFLLEKSLNLGPALALQTTRFLRMARTSLSIPFIDIKRNTSRELEQLVLGRLTRGPQSSSLFLAHLGRCLWVGLWLVLATFSLSPSCLPGRWCQSHLFFFFSFHQSNFKDTRWWRQSPIRSGNDHVEWHFPAGQYWFVMWARVIFVLSCLRF